MNTDKDGEHHLTRMDNDRLSRLALCSKQLDTERQGITMKSETGLSISLGGQKDKKLIYDSRRNEQPIYSN